MTAGAGAGGLVAVLVYLAVLLALPPRSGAISAVQPGRRSGGVGHDRDRGILFRLRWVLSGLALAAGWTILGGPLGCLLGLVVGWVSFRALSAAEGPAARRRREELARDLPVGVDLLGATVAAGGAVEQGLVLVAAALPGAMAEEFDLIHHRLALGADPVTVWREVAQQDELGPLGRAMARTHESGAPVVEAIGALGEELRDRARFEVEARAKRVDVRSAGPLGVCLLPAFVLVGIVPMVAGLFSATGLF